MVAFLLLYYRIHFNGSLEAVDRHIHIRYGARAGGPNCFHPPFSRCHALTLFLSQFCNCFVTTIGLTHAFIDSVRFYSVRCIGYTVCR